MRTSQFRQFAFGRSGYTEPEATPAKQADCLAYITKCIQETAVPPSVEEMRVHLGLSSKSGIHRMLTALEQDRKIRRLPHRARAIEVVGLAFPEPPPAYPRDIPVLDTSVGYQFFTVSKDGPEADAKLVEMAP